MGIHLPITSYHILQVGKTGSFHRTKALNKKGLTEVSPTYKYDYSAGRSWFKIIPTMALKAVPEMMSGPISSTAPPSPMTNILLAMIRLRALEKSSCSSIITFKPFDAMTP